MAEPWEDPELRGCFKFWESLSKPAGSQRLGKRPAFSQAASARTRALLLPRQNTSLPMHCPPPSQGCRLRTSCRLVASCSSRSTSSHQGPRSCWTPFRGHRRRLGPRCRPPQTAPAMCMNAWARLERRASVWRCLLAAFGCAGAPHTWPQRGPIERAMHVFVCVTRLMHWHPKRPPFYPVQLPHARPIHP